MRYDLVRPCPGCPFRTDAPGYLRGTRAREIAESIATGAPFACHQTTVPTEDESGLVATADSQQCAGALIVQEKQGVLNQMGRIAERLGLYDRARLDMGAPVAASLDDFIRHHDDDDEDADLCCEVCDSACLAPAGMLVGGVALSTPREELDETSVCPDCGTRTCEACECYCGESEQSVRLTP